MGPLKEKFSLPISIFHSLLPHPQREVLFVSLTTSSTSTPHLRGLATPLGFSSLSFHFIKHVSYKQDLNLAFEFFPLSSPTLKENFSLPISIFHSLLPHPQRELLVVSLKNLSPP